MEILHHELFFCFVFLLPRLHTHWRTAGQPRQANSQSHVSNCKLSTSYHQPCLIYNCLLVGTPAAALTLACARRRPDDWLTWMIFKEGPQLVEHASPAACVIKFPLQSRLEGLRGQLASYRVSGRHAAYYIMKLYGRLGSHNNLFKSDTGVWWLPIIPEPLLGLCRCSAVQQLAAFWIRNNFCIQINRTSMPKQRHGRIQQCDSQQCHNSPGMLSAHMP